MEVDYVYNIINSCQVYCINIICLMCKLHLCKYMLILVIQNFYSATFNIYIQKVSIVKKKTKSTHTAQIFMMANINNSLFTAEYL